MLKKINESKLNLQHEIDQEHSTVPNDEMYNTRDEYIFDQMHDEDEVELTDSCSASRAFEGIFSEDGNPEEAQNICEPGDYDELNKIYNEPLDPNALWRVGTTLLIGDSMLYGVEESRLRNTKVRIKPGSSVEDMFFHITPYLRKQPTNIICHVGTNNANTDSSDKIIEKLAKLRDYIKSKLPNCQLIFSSLINRNDNANARLVVENTNKKLEHLNCQVLDNENITNDYLGKKGLHLVPRGTSRLAMNVINILKQL